MLLLVNHDRSELNEWQNSLKEWGMSFQSTREGFTALQMVAVTKITAVISRIDLPLVSGYDLAQRLKKEFPGLIIALAAPPGKPASPPVAGEGKSWDFGPFPSAGREFQKLVGSILLAEGSLLREKEKESLLFSGPEGFEEIVGLSPRMREIFSLIRKVRDQDVTVLIQGESGTGKELIARALHRHSRRDGRPFVSINCAALPENLLESELFGHEKGAFTGAIKTKLGRFERCHGGTIFLDEIGDMSLLTQTKILRVLQEKSFERLGGTETITVDVRVIAATNKNLEKLIEGGGFREDLFYRLSVVHITIPPLNKRPSDIPELINYFIQKYNRDRQQPLEGITDRAHAFLAAQPWPGNVRELENAIQRAMVLCPGQVLRTEDFSFLQSPDSVIARPAGDDIENLAERLLQQARKKPGMQLVPEMERLLIETALRETGGNQVKAARLLGISRNTLRNRIEKFGLKGKED